MPKTTNPFPIVAPRDIIEELMVSKEEFEWANDKLLNPCCQQHVRMAIQLNEAYQENYN